MHLMRDLKEVGAAKRVASRSGPLENVVIHVELPDLGRCTLTDRERVLMKSTNDAAALMSVILDRKPNPRFALICTMNNFKLSKQACPRR